MIMRETVADILRAAGVKSADETSIKLSQKFQTLDRLFSADSYSLSDIVGDRVAMLLKLSVALTSRRVTENFVFGVSHAEEEIKEYLIALYRGISVETLYMLSLDSSGRILACDYINEGTVNATSIIPRQILERALKNSAESIIIAHNHPGGIAMPSKEDIDFTSNLNGILENAGIKLYAHYTVAGQSCSTLR